MALKRLQKVPTSLDDAIKRGAAVVSDQQTKEWTNFLLRIREDILTDIDQALENRIGLSKTAWILEAIQEKLKREV